MAKDRSPESVGERTMFAPDAAPFNLTPAPPRPLHRRTESLSSPASDLSSARGSFHPTRSSARRALPCWRSRCAGPLAEKTVLPSRAAAARAVRLAVSTELDRGIAFILAPVFLAVGALVYFSLGHEPGFLPLARRRACPWRCCAFVQPRAAGPAYGARRRAALRARRAARQGRDLARRHKNARRRGDDAAFRPRRRGRASRQRPGAAHHRRHRHRAPGAALCAGPRARLGAQHS